MVSAHTDASRDAHGDVDGLDMAVVPGLKSTLTSLTTTRGLSDGQQPLVVAPLRRDEISHVVATRSASQHVYSNVAQEAVGVNRSG